MCSTARGRLDPLPDVASDAIDGLRDCLIAFKTQRTFESLSHRAIEPTKPNKPNPTESALKFIHCSDLHLDSPLDGLERYPGAPVAALRGATRQALTNLVSLAIERAADFVVIVGDVFDGDWRDMNTGLFFNHEMRRLERAGIPVYLKHGNHDALSELTRSLSLPANVQVFAANQAQTFRIDALRVALHGRSFARRSVPEDLAAAYPDPVPGYFNIGVLHTSLAGYAAHDAYAPTSLDVLRGRGYDYWALGHVHAREVLSEAHPRIVYCGNLQGRHAAELGAKGCEWVEVTAGQVRAEPVAVDVLRWAQIEVSIAGLHDVSELWAHARDVMQQTAVAAEGRLGAWRVIVTGVGPVHQALAARPDELLAELRSLADAASAGRAWIEKVQVRTRAPIDRQRLEDDDAIGECLRQVAALQADPTALASWCEPVLSELLNKLPAALRVECLEYTCIGR